MIQRTQTLCFLVANIVICFATEASGQDDPEAESRIYYGDQQWYIDSLLDVFLTDLKTAVGQQDASAISEMLNDSVYYSENYFEPKHVFLDAWGLEDGTAISIFWPAMEYIMAWGGDYVFTDETHHYFFPYPLALFYTDYAEFDWSQTWWVMEEMVPVQREGEENAKIVGCLSPGPVLQADWSKKACDKCWDGWTCIQASEKLAGCVSIDYLWATTSHHLELVWIGEEWKILAFFDGER